MTSVADQLRRDTADRVRRLPVAERIALALAIGDDDLALYMQASGKDREAALQDLRDQHARAHAEPLSVAAAMTALERVCAILDAHHIPCALIGAAALAARGVARSTYDIDLLATDGRALEDDTWSTLRPAASIDIRRGDVDDPLRGVIRIALATERPIDVVVGKHAWQTRAIERAERLTMGPPVVLARDLILLKLYAGGAQDLWDIRELLQQHDRAVESDVAADLPALPAELQHRWESVRRA